jgi:hypothetical protein
MRLVQHTHSGCNLTALTTVEFTGTRIESSNRGLKLFAVRHIQE